MDNEHDCDLQLTLNAQFGTKILNSIRFPWSAQYDFQPAHYPFDVFEKGQKEVDDEDSEIVVDDVLAESFQKQFETEEPQRRYAGESTASSDNSDPSDGENEEEENSRYKIDFYSVSLMVPEKPKVVLGNPVKIDDLTVRIKARFRASIRVFGKEYATHKSTPWVTLCGRSATLKLFSEGTKILGTVVLNDIDLVAKVKIFKWHYDCQLGLTKLMNKHLAKRSAFKLLDLSGFQQSLTPESERVAIERIEFDETSDQLLVKLFVNNAKGDCADSATH